MDIAELHDEENLHTQMEDRWENYGSLDGIIDSDDPFTIQGAPRFELTEKLNSLLSNALPDMKRRILQPYHSHEQVGLLVNHRRLQ